jgi:hypothetical protein
MGLVMLGANGFSAFKFSLPFALSPSKGEIEATVVEAVPARSGFDRLSPNGVQVGISVHRSA